MPSYDFRCTECAHEFTLHYKRISDYARATPQCPQCESTQLDRIIRRVTVQGVQGHDFSKMDAQQMLSVLESGDERAVKTMYDQVGAKPAPDKMVQTKPSDSDNKE